MKRYPESTAISLSLIEMCACLILLGSWGCQMTLPTPPHGVLSTIHQKCLELATNRALDQAGVSKDLIGRDKVFLAFGDVQESDLGKQHVRRVAEDRFRDDSAGIVGSPGDATKQITCQVLLAGVDVSRGAFFGFEWLNTKAETQVRIKLDGPTSTEKEGSGTAVYQQVWWLGIGPSEKLK